MVRLFRLHQTYNHVQPGDYRVIRLFDRNRVMCEVSKPYTYYTPSMKKVLTLLPIKRGQLL